MDFEYFMPVQMYFGKDVVIKYEEEFRKYGN
jgi:alcohol dehydrogenase YqhD (iron-dependent ADH family)